MASFDLIDRLRNISSQNSGDLFGVADVTPARDFITVQGGQNLGEYPRAISTGMQLIDSILDLDLPDETRELSLYWHQVYAVMVPLLDFLSYKISRGLQNEGFRVFPVKAFKDREFTTEEPVEMRFNAGACGEFRRIHPCGVCVAACPRGRKRKKSPRL